MFSFIIYSNHYLLLHKCAHYNIYIYIYIYIYVEENIIEELLSKKSYFYEHESANMFYPINYSNCVINYLL